MLQPRKVGPRPRLHLAGSDPALDEASAAASRTRTRKAWLVRLGLAVAVVASSYGIWHLLVGRNFVSTDNAYVSAESANITPLVSAMVTAVRVRDTQSVKAGDILVELDPANARIALAQAEADLAVARRRFRQSIATNSALSAQISVRGADIARAQARLDAARAEAEKARIDLQRREFLAGSGAVSGEELTAARKADVSARAVMVEAQAAVNQAIANRQAARGELAANNATIAGSTEATDPSVMAAAARVDAARLDLERTIIRAPINGVVTRRQVQVGQRVTQGVPIMLILPLSQVYVEANFKEVQLRRVKVGMSAEVTADIYGPDVVYHGKVAGIGGGTGASMAIIPAQNATGNWIKVVQRLPIRIELDPRELAKHPLRVGLSTEVAIDLLGD